MSFIATWLVLSAVTGIFLCRLLAISGPPSSLRECDKSEQRIKRGHREGSETVAPAADRLPQGTEFVGSHETN
jgi:hypothetical protein